MCFSEYVIGVDVLFQRVWYKCGGVVSDSMVYVSICCFRAYVIGVEVLFKRVWYGGRMSRERFVLCEGLARESSLRAVTQESLS